MARPSSFSRQAVLARTDPKDRTRDKGQPLYFFFHHLPGNQLLFRVALNHFLKEVARFAAARRNFFGQPLVERRVAGGAGHGQGGGGSPLAAGRLAFAAEQRF